MTRVQVIGGPWPERIGCEARDVTDELDPDVYPRYGLGKDEIIIRFDDDPVTAGRSDHPAYARWSCVIKRDAVRVIDEA